MRLQGFGLAPDLSLYFNRIPKQKTKRLLFDLNSFLYFINWHGVSHLLHMEVKLWTPVLWWKDIARARGVPEPVAVSTGGQRGNVWIGRQVRYPPCIQLPPFHCIDCNIDGSSLFVTPFAVLSFLAACKERIWKYNQIITALSTPIQGHLLPCAHFKRAEIEKKYCFGLHTGYTVIKCGSSTIRSTKFVSTKYLV